MSGWRRPAALAGIFGLGLAQAWAQPARIYSCVDAGGRRLTSDRPILECNDREQKLLSSTGGVRAVLPPTPTAREREAKAEQERKLEAEKLRLAEEKRAERALVGRYPNQAVHDGERVKALRAVEDVAVSMHRHIEELNQQKKKLLEEAEFYKKDPSKYPVRLKRQMEENEQQLAAQRRFLATQEEEKVRVNARFDEELGRLKPLWAGPPAAAPAAASAAGVAAGPARLR